MNLTSVWSAMILLSLVSTCGLPEPDRALPPELAAWTTHAMVKVRPGDPAGSETAVQLSAARNEFEPFQLVLRAERRAVRDVDVELSDLVETAGAGRIASEHATIYLQRYSWLELPSSVEGERGEWPDALLPRVDSHARERRTAFPFDLEPGRNQPLWIEIYVPLGTTPGAYRGELLVSVGGSRRLMVPVALRVWSFSLPSTSSLRTSFGFSGVTALEQHRGSYTSDEDLLEITRVYAIAALRHRISIHGGSWMPPPATYTPEGAVLDWARYDHEVAPLLDGTAFPPTEALPGARLTSIDLRTAGGLDDQQKVQYWRAWREHFERRGWLDRLFLYVWDEPQAGRDYREVARLARLAREAALDLPILLTEQLVPELIPVIDLWVTLVNCVDARPDVDGYCEQNVPRAAYAVVKPRGSSLWWYQSCASHGCDHIGGSAFTGWPSYVIDAAPVAHRIMPWLAWSYDIDGELYYNTVESYGIVDDPWTEVRTHGGNGDGTLFYPGTPSRIGGETHIPIESLRLKLIREGLEDYEYLVLAARAGRGELADAVARRLAPQTYDWEHSPDALFGARRALAEALEGLDRKGSQETAAVGTPHEGTPRSNS